MLSRFRAVLPGPACPSRGGRGPRPAVIVLWEQHSFAPQSLARREEGSHRATAMTVWEEMALSPIPAGSHWSSNCAGQRCPRGSGWATAPPRSLPQKPREESVCALKAIRTHKHSSYLAAPHHTEEVFLRGAPKHHGHELDARFGRQRALPPLKVVALAQSTRKVSRCDDVLLLAVECRSWTIARVARGGVLPRHRVAGARDDALGRKRGPRAQARCRHQHDDDRARRGRHRLFRAVAPAVPDLAAQAELRLPQPILAAVGPRAVHHGQQVGDAWHALMTRASAAAWRLGPTTPWPATPVWRTRRPQTDDVVFDLMIAACNYITNYLRVHSSDPGHENDCCSAVVSAPHAPHGLHGPSSAGRQSRSLQAAPAEKQALCSFGAHRRTFTGTRTSPRR